LKFFYHESEDTQEAKLLEGRIIFTAGFPGNDRRAAAIATISFSTVSQTQSPSLV
jgi:hypothetical protein